MWLPPIVTVFFGLRAWTSKVSGALLTCSTMKASSNRTRSPSRGMPAALKSSMAFGWRKSTPISLRMTIACRWIWSTSSSLRRLTRGRLLRHTRGLRRRGQASVGMRRLAATAPGLEGAGVDLAIVAGVDVPGVADGLRVGLGFLRQHRDLPFGEAELLQAGDLDVLGQTVDGFDGPLRRLPGGEPVDVLADRLRDPGEALRLTRVVVLHHRREQASGQRAVRGVVHPARRLAHGVGRARRVRAVGETGEHGPERHVVAGLQVVS